MSNWEDEISRHTQELVKLTLRAADQGPEPLPEDEVAKLGMVIATERQLLIDAMSGLVGEDEPEAAASPGVAEFDAGFVYGLAFASALDDAENGTRSGAARSSPEARKGKRQQSRRWTTEVMAASRP